MSNYFRRGRLQTCVLVLIGFVVLAAHSLAEELPTLNNSLSEVPADAGFYVAFLRNREQVEIVARSKAWKQLRSMTGIEEGWKRLRASKEFSNSIDGFQRWWQDPANRELIDALTDLLSEEVFAYGGSNVTEVGDLIGRIYTVALAEGFRRAIEEGRTGRKLPQNSEEDTYRIMFDVLVKNSNTPWVPDLVLGCRIKKPELAHALIQKVEKLLRADLDRYPEFKDNLRWTKVDGHDFLIYSLDSKLFQFNEQSVRKYEKKPGEYDAIVDRMKKLRIMASIGIRGQYLILALGESTRPLTDG
jgi:hypothetical protein